MKKVPNIITIIRIILSIVLLWTSPFYASFYLVYVLCGLSDVMDGYIARRFNVTSKLGAQLDSIADFCLVTATIIKVIPTIYIPITIIIWVIILAVIRIVSIVIGLIKYKRLVMLHTYANKMTGVVLFGMIIACPLINNDILFTSTCIIATFASIEELIINIESKKVNLNVKGVFIKGSRMKEKIDTYCGLSCEICE